VTHTGHCIIITEGTQVCMNYAARRSRLRCARTYAYCSDLAGVHIPQAKPRCTITGSLSSKKVHSRHYVYFLFFLLSTLIPAAGRSAKSR